LVLFHTFIILVHIQCIDVGGDAAASARRHGSLVAGVLATACVSWLFKIVCFLWLETQYPKTPKNVGKEGKSQNEYLPVQVVEEGNSVVELTANNLSHHDTTLNDRTNNVSTTLNSLPNYHLAIPLTITLTLTHILVLNINLLFLTLRYNSYTNTYPLLHLTLTLMQTLTLP
jgi:hypothetical protein